VQVNGREIGIWIDSDHPRPALGSLLPITPCVLVVEHESCAEAFQRVGS